MPKDQVHKVDKIKSPVQFFWNSSITSVVSNFPFFWWIMQRQIQTNSNKTLSNIYNISEGSFQIPFQILTLSWMWVTPSLSNKRIPPWLYDEKVYDWWFGRQFSLLMVMVTTLRMAYITFLLAFGGPGHHHSSHLLPSPREWSECSEKADIFSEDHKCFYYVSSKGNVSPQIRWPILQISPTWSDFWAFFEMILSQS